LAFADNFFVALLAMLIAGAADGPQLAAIFAVRHREAPERSRSQVFTTGASLKITAAAIGALLAGHFAAKSLGFTIVTAGLVQLAAAASFAISSLLFQFESARIECSMSASMEFTDPKLVTIYDAVNPIDDKIGFFVELAQTLHAKKIIDLGCGTGLLSHELAKDGHMVIGVEPAAAMIEQAKHKYGNEAQWIVGGSEKLDASMQGDMVIMTGHVAQFFLEDEGWVQALQNIHRAIKPGGYLVFESRNPEVRPFADWPTSDHHDRITNTPLGPVEWWSDGLVTADGFAKYTLHYLFSDTSEEIVSDNKLCFRTFEALQAFLENAGFEVEKVYGDWNSSPFESHSPEMIFIAKAL
jgi:SAM-dependent methyltransferase